MAYSDYLWRMLDPLGVYSRDGYSGAEVTAVGAALDNAESVINGNFRESFPGIAEEAGLEDAEALFPMLPETETEARQEALCKLFQTDNLSFTLSGIQSTLEGCGIHATVEEGQNQTCTVEFQEPMTLEHEPVFTMWILEQILPCHLGVTVSYQYMGPEDEELSSESISLENARARTQAQWEALLGT